MTELEILRRRRELVALSAGLQRATLVRRLDHVHRNPLHAAAAIAGSAVSIPLALSLLRSAGLPRVLALVDVFKFLNRKTT